MPGNELESLRHRGPRYGHRQQEIEQDVRRVGLDGEERAGDIGIFRKRYLIDEHAFDFRGAVSPACQPRSCAAIWIAESASTWNGESGSVFMVRPPGTDI